MKCVHTMIGGEAKKKFNKTNESKMTKICHGVT